MVALNLYCSAELAGIEIIMYRNLAAVMCSVIQQVLCDNGVAVLSTLALLSGAFGTPLKSSKLSIVNFYFFPCTPVLASTKWFTYASN